MRLKTILYKLVVASAASACVSMQAGEFKTLDYLYEISGQQTVAGQHNREPNSDPDRWTNKIESATGRFPGLWSADFLFDFGSIRDRRFMIKEAIEQWESGAIVNIMWHACSPALKTPCDWSQGNGPRSKLTDAQWVELTTDGTRLNSKWKKMMDEIAGHLQKLEDAGVEVVFRPLHEMNQGQFWWGGRPGAQGTAKLFRITHDYFENDKGLSNLIWTWDMQDFPTLEKDLELYNPGDDYWDILALDIYEGYSKWKYDVVVKTSNGKPVAIGESQSIPSKKVLKEQPKWVFFMAWAELVFEHNKTKDIKKTYKAKNVITLEEMPGWD